MTISRLIDCLKAFPEDREVLVSSDDGAVNFSIEEQNERIVLASEKSIEDIIDEETMGDIVPEKFTVARAMEVMSEKIAADELFGEYDDKLEEAVELDYA